MTLATWQSKELTSLHLFCLTCLVLWIRFFFLTLILCIFIWLWFHVSLLWPGSYVSSSEFGHMCPPSLKGRMCSCSDLNPIWSHEFRSLYSSSDLGPMSLLLSLFLCVPLLTWVLCIFFWLSSSGYFFLIWVLCIYFWLGSYAFLFWPRFYVSSSDLDPMRSSSDQGSMYLLLTLILCVPLLNWVLYIFFWLLSPLIISADLGPMRSPSDLGPMDLLLTLILCVHLLTWDMCIFFWRWSYAFLFWPEFYVSSSDFVLMRSFSDLGPMNLLLTLILYVPLLTCVLCIFFWLGSSAFLFWPAFYISSSDLDPLRCPSDLGPVNLLLTLILCVPLLNWVLVSSSDFDPMRSSSDHGPMNLLLTLVLCIPPLTWVHHMHSYIGS
jgi:hypothetical protein